jgi:hypothetical protein
VSGTADAPSLDAALDELYGVAPDEFVSTRTRLAADLKAAGDNDAAKELKAARRPTVAAWTLNQLCRREPDRLEEFLARSRALRDAAPDDLRAALAAQRASFTDLADAALGVLGTRANEAHRAQITASLHAAAADAVVAEQLVQGRLTREIDEVGFPSTEAGATNATKRAPAARRPPPAARAPAPEPDARAERRRQEARRTEERARLDTTLAETERSAGAAERAHDGAQRAVEQAKADLDRARREERDAADRARKARKLVEQLRRERDRLSD